MSKTTIERHAGLRIWVALDESPRSTAALTAAAALAEELDAELAGLFVEDVDLQHLFGLPFAREFSVLTGEGRPLSQGEVERTWRRQAETQQRLLAEAAGRLRLRWSFRVTRGRVSAEVNTLAQAFDLIVLGKRTGIGVMAVAQTTARLAYLHPKVGPVLVLFEDLSTSSRSLETGAMLARSNGAELVLLVKDGDEDAYRAACTAAQTVLKARGAAGRCVRLNAIEGGNLIQAARREEAGCLVLAGRERFLSQAGFDRMLDAIECPVVLAR
ncbi:MAG TPA: universal stress protein [Thiobacillus sp.]|nr:universal stress protein [Thiobacillus sp.]